MSIDNIPEGFKLLPNRHSGQVPSEIKRRRYALSEKGEIFDVTNEEILVAPEGGTVIKIREETPDRLYEAEFDIPILLSRYFPEGK